ncbi:transcriptional regulator, AraC family [Maricaulis maris MCS10]|uniref:Transcriptional regulator, AraC family n=1 Tax=Maricaulis maris (strain MCS10) TaxID=394221 RepID=Q0AQ58_MARMM|nr:helix-turn-helix domain-containing protein [Maricaulis maris]ABI65579.1 transcriptional regulator, AraC family [Maricaulis maris MCS10]
MLEVANAIKFAICIAAIASILIVVSRRQRSGLQIAWACFCTGLAAVMVREVFGSTPAALTPLLIVAGCASCSCIWLVARGLFRTDVRFGWPQALVVSGIFLPAVLVQLLTAASAERVFGVAGMEAITAATYGFQGMLSSTVLVLAFWEGLRGWTQSAPVAERRLRVAFLGSFGLGVGICVMLLDHGDSTRFDPALMALLQAGCAATIFLVTGFGVVWRSRNPLLAAGRQPHTSSEADKRADQELGEYIRARVEADALYLDPDLKVASLARHLREPDYRISRAITAGLGERNFNRFINRYRINHAKDLLRANPQGTGSILDVALDSGFASIGPFNRAFKESVGMTPREYRNGRIRQAARPVHLPQPASR